MTRTLPVLRTRLSALALPSLALGCVTLFDPYGGGSSSGSEASSGSGASSAPGASACAGICDKGVECGDSAEAAAQCKEQCLVKVAGGKMSEAFWDHIAKCSAKLSCDQLKAGTAVKDCSVEAGATLPTPPGTEDKCARIFAKATECGGKPDRDACTFTARIMKEADFASFAGCADLACSEALPCFDRHKPS